MENLAETSAPAEPRHSPPMQGVAAAILAAVLFGSSTVLAKGLADRIHPVTLAGLFYLGSGLGLGAFWIVRRVLSGQKSANPLTRRQLPWLGAAILSGGVLGPVLLMAGLRSTPASSASLLLNLEGVFTAGLAWAVFREHFDRRILLGMLLIVAGGVLLSWSGRPASGLPWGALAVAGACACWGLDNNFTRHVSEADPILIAGLKGGIAGAFNLALGWSIHPVPPGLLLCAAAGLVGLAGYGISLVLFVIALRQVGTARTGAYFSTGPFFGAFLSLFLLHEPLTAAFVAAALCMAGGVWLHLTERHEHGHTHAPLFHAHGHVHDAHHRHDHAPGQPPADGHAHPHAHDAVEHVHPHFPDIHHRHPHRKGG